MDVRKTRRRLVRDSRFALIVLTLVSGWLILDVAGAEEAAPTDLVLSRPLLNRTPPIDPVEKRDTDIPRTAASGAVMLQDQPIRRLAQSKVEMPNRRRPSELHGSHRRVELQGVSAIRKKLSQQNLAPAVDDHHVPTFVKIPKLSAAANERAGLLISDGIKMAERGGYYSARLNFIKALRLVTRSLDAESNSQFFSKSLASGMRALEEAEEFSPSGSNLEGTIDVQRIVLSHQTPVLKNRLDVNTMQALQAYHGYAELQLSRACGKERVASQAIFCLARIQPLLASSDGSNSELVAPRSMIMYQVALSADSNNSLAANELGVLFAKFGQLRDAKSALTHCVTVNPSLVSAWQNLAKVHQRLGETQLAQAAQLEAENIGKARVRPREKIRVDWVDNQSFSKGSERGAVTRLHQPNHKWTDSVRHRVTAWFGSNAKNRK